MTSPTFIEAEFQSPCRYCHGEDIRKGEKIAGWPGVLYGHTDCAQRAWNQDQLIISTKLHGLIELPPADILPSVTRALTSHKPGGKRRKKGEKPMTVVFTGPHIGLTHAEWIRKALEATYLHHPRRETMVERYERRSLEHNNIRILGTKTGRISCDKPNVSNKPRKLAKRPSFVDRKRPDHLPTCPCFGQPHLLMHVIMPMKMRPYKRDVTKHELRNNGEGAGPFQEILRRVWEELMRKRWSHYHATERGHHLCAAHGHDFGQTKVYEARHTPYERSWWVYCDGVKAEEEYKAKLLEQQMDEVLGDGKPKS